jgi:type II secretory pathway component GspD/PulD (secretin)
MSEQDSNEQLQEPVADQEISDATTQEARSAESEIMARLSKLEAENTKLRQESASRRVKAKEANDARQAALEENNQFKAFMTTGSPSKPPPQAAPAAPKASVDFSMAGNDPALLKQLIRDNPDQWDEYIGKKSNTGNGTFIGRALNRGN